MIIAIDGPAGSGKSTVARLVAEELGFSYLDTGAMYRAVTWRALQKGISPSDSEKLAVIARNEPIRFGYTQGESLPSEVFINNEDVTKAIRTPEVDRSVSEVSAVPEVRTALVFQQQEIGKLQNTVMEGRDIGTVVFPDAELKIFLTASPRVRAERRLKQNAARFGEDVQSEDLDKVLEEIIRRDTYDSERETSPLMAAEDALLLDTSAMSIPEVVSWIAEHARSHPLYSKYDRASQS